MIGFQAPLEHSDVESVISYLTGKYGVEVSNGNVAPSAVSPTTDKIGDVSEPVEARTSEEKSGEDKPIEVPTKPVQISLSSEELGLNTASHSPQKIVTSTPIVEKFPSEPAVILEKPKSSGDSTARMPTGGVCETHEDPFKGTTFRLLVIIFILN